MSKARDIASAAPAPSTVSATEIGYLDGVTSAVQTQIDSKEPTLPSQTGNSGKYLTTDGSAKSWGTVTQYSLPSQTGNSGKYLTTNGTTESWGTVNQPITFTHRLPLDNQIYAIAYNGSNLYVAGGSSGILYSSTDGITWTSRTSGFSTNTIESIAYGNGLWVAVGDSGTIATSTDGTTWTTRTSNMGTNRISKVVYANSLWVAVGAGGGSTNTGGIIYSTDGITWTRKSQTPTIGTTYRDVVWNGTNWIVVGDYSTNNYLYASAPSGTWTEGTTTGGERISGIAWDGTRHITWERSDFQPRYSTSTTLGTTTQYTTAHNLSSVSLGKNQYCYYNGKMYCASTNYIGVFTPSSNTTPVMEPAFLAIGRQIASGLEAASVTIFVGAIGYILGTGYGIYTSF